MIDTERQLRHDLVPPDYYERGVKTNLAQWLWHRWRLRIIRKMLTTLPRARTLLDLGCHSGWLTDQLRIWTGAEVSGIDFSDRAIAYGRRRYPAVLFRLGDLADGLPFPDATFDLVTSFDVFEHLTDTPAALREALRVLKPGGYVLLVIPSGQLFNSVWAIWTRSKGAVWEDLHVAETTDRALTRAMAEAGLAPVFHRTSHLGMSHYLCGRKAP